MSGINTPADLRKRCRVTDNGCWHWKGAADSNGRPTVWHPVLRARVSIGVLACFWATGARPLKGQAWHITCATPNCANPKHRTCGTRSSQMLAAKMERTLEQRLHIAAGRRKAGKLTDAQVAEIRRSKASLAELEAAYGVHRGYACSVRSGKVRSFGVTDDVKVLQPVAPWNRPVPRGPGLFAQLGIGHYMPDDSALSAPLKEPQ